MTPEEVRQIVREEIALHIAERHTRGKKSGQSPEGFERFWSIWTRKVGRGEAEKAWAQLSPGPLLVETIVNAATEQVAVLDEEWKKHKRKYQPHPATWLRRKQWTDQIESGKKPQLVRPVTLCACGCGRDARRERGGQMWHLDTCWWEATKRKNEKDSERWE